MATASADDRQERRALVTGGIGDTGAVIADHLHRHGAKVWTTTPCRPGSPIRAVRTI